ncbi:MAG: ZIP family metal transporter [Ignisphaera sp.]
MDPILWLASAIESITDSIVIQSFLAASIGFILTVIGATPALIGANVGEAIMSYGMGFAAGVMISASFTSLLIPALEIGGILPVIVGFTLGALTIYVMDRVLPHEHIFKGGEGSEKLRRKLKTTWLLAMAIIIHNIPEGAAVGAAVTESLRGGVLLAIAIGVQNIPEGLAVSLPLVTVHKKVNQALWIVMLSGIVEPIAASFATILASISKDILPYMLSFAAGAMVYVVSHEIIPETHSEKREIRATIALLIGLMLMFMLDAYYR